MSYEASNGTESTAPTASAMPTGYRVGVVPGAIEVSARLGTAAEVRELIKVLRAGILIFADDGDTDDQKNSPTALQRSRLLLSSSSGPRAVTLNMKFGNWASSPSGGSHTARASA
jgi:hypothetical protein